MLVSSARESYKPEVVQILKSETLEQVGHSESDFTSAVVVLIASFHPHLHSMATHAVMNCVWVCVFINDFNLA